MSVARNYRRRRLPFLNDSASRQVVHPGEATLRGFYGRRAVPPRNKDIATPFNLAARLPRSSKLFLPLICYLRTVFLCYRLLTRDGNMNFHCSTDNIKYSRIRVILRNHRVPLVYEVVIEFYRNMDFHRKQFDYSLSFS